MSNEQFCTNCGHQVSEQAIACTSCGAAPFRHRKFCRHCGSGLNPEQVVCVKCGAGLAGSSVMGGNWTAKLMSALQTTSAPLDPVRRKDRITFWTTLCTVTYALWVCLILFSNFLTYLFAVDQTLPQEELARYSFYFSAYLVLTVPIGLGYFFCFYCYLLRIWQEIPVEHARTTPEKAAAFSIIPYYCWYWLFTAFVGLYRDMNKATESYGLGPRFNVTLIKTACICWVVFAFFTFAAGRAANLDVGAFGAMVWTSFSAAVTFPVLWRIHKDVLEFIDIKSNSGKQTQSVGDK